MRKRLRDDQPASWVFTGDDGARLHPEKQSLASLFEAEVRDAAGRVDDVITDTTKPRDRLATLWQEARQRILRHEPAAAFLLLGAGDPRPGRVRQETAALGRLVEVIAASGAQPVLLTPPAYLIGDADAIERQHHRAAIVADEFKVPLVDFADCRRPSDASRLLLRHLGFATDSDVVPVAAPTPSVAAVRVQPVVPS